LPTGKRPHGRPLKRYKDQLKQTLQKTNIDVKTWETIARDRPLWRRTIHEGSDHFEKMRKEEAEEKRQRRKAGAALPPVPATIFCDQCPVFSGLVSVSSATNELSTLCEPRCYLILENEELPTTTIALATNVLCCISVTCQQLLLQGTLESGFPIPFIPYKL